MNVDTSGVVGLIALGSMDHGANVNVIGLPETIAIKFAAKEPNTDAVVESLVLFDAVPLIEYFVARLGSIFSSSYVLAGWEWDRSCGEREKLDSESPGHRKPKLNQKMNTKVLDTEIKNKKPHIRDCDKLQCSTNHIVAVA